MTAEATLTMPKHVEIAYKDAIDNIMFGKRQQWVITNYSIAIYAAIFAIGRTPTLDLDYITKIALSALVVIVLGYHLYFIAKLQRNLTKFRIRLFWIYQTYFTESERVGLFTTNLPKSFWYDPGIIVGLVGVSVIGAALTCWFLWRSQA